MPWPDRQSIRRTRRLAQYCEGYSNKRVGVQTSNHSIGHRDDNFMQLPNELLSPHFSRRFVSDVFMVQLGFGEFSYFRNY
jgi:hypothetical protein